jgi:LysM repeat protein
MKRRYVLRNKKRFFTFLLSLTLILIAILASTTAYSYNPNKSITVEVCEGDSLWKIASNYYDNGDIRKHISNIQKANDLSSYIIQPGDQLILPQ